MGGLLENKEKKETVNLSKFKFCFHLTAHDCFNEKTGRCPVDKNRQENLDLQSCYDLGQKILECGFKPNLCDTFCIHKHPCGRYTSNMQHRTCIMKKLDVDIPADMVHISSSGICIECRWTTRLKAFFQSDDVFYSL